MSFFTNKLLQRKAPERKLSKSLVKLDEDAINSSTITLTLGEMKTTFDNGRWIPEYGNEANNEHLSLKTQITRLKEENNLLKLKYEILLDMMAQESVAHKP